MIRPFGFASATEIRFGQGVFGELPERLAALGDSVLLVHGQNGERIEGVSDALRAKGIKVSTCSVGSEPTIEQVESAAEEARQDWIKVVAAVGGGSVIDAGKAIAALLTNRDDVRDYLEVIGRGRPLEEPSAPFIAVPTTAGTGAEVTRNAVLTARAEGVKVSLRSDLMLPRLALVDPALTVSMPAPLTACSGMDALTQLVEPFVSSRSNPMTDLLCLDGIRLIVRSLRQAHAAGDDLAARQNMSLASLFGGLALANAGLGAAHGFAGAIGGRYGAPHGAICARMLPLVMEANVRALKERQPDSEALTRFREVAQTLTGDPAARAMDGIIWVQDLGAALQIPLLADYGVKEEQFEALVEQARKSSSMQANPIRLSREELSQILRKAVFGV